MPKPRSARLQELGAVLQVVQPSEHVLVLNETEGNEFCLLSWTIVGSEWPLPRPMQ